MQDVAGVDQLLQDSVATATIPIEERISLSEEDGGTSSSTSSPSLSPSPPSSYQTESYSMEYSHVQQLKPSATSVMSNSHVLLSPIAGDVPMIHQVTSPSLPQFEFASTEVSGLLLNSVCSTCECVSMYVCIRASFFIGQGSTLYTNNNYKYRVSWYKWELHSFSVVHANACCLKFFTCEA